MRFCASETKPHTSRAREGTLPPETLLPVDDVLVVSSKPGWLSLEIRCTLEAAEHAVEFVRASAADMPRKVREDIAAAFREVLFNAVEHGGGLDPRKRVEISLWRTGRAWMAHVRDPGSGFSMGCLPNAAVCNPANDPMRHVEVREEHGQRPGGFGILIARKLLDELAYNERGNEALLVKYVKG